MKAGEGEHQATLIQSTEDKAILTVQKHYLAVDAVSWFVNQESGWFKDRMATGTISIKIGSQESYHVALGLYDLKGGRGSPRCSTGPCCPNGRIAGGRSRSRS